MKEERMEEHRIRLENEGYLDAATERSPMYLQGWPRHDGRPMFTIMIGSTANADLKQAADFREYGIHLTPQQARDLAASIVSALAAFESKSDKLGLP